MPTFSVRVSGKVQGVGFRAYVMRLAREYHLLGEVWNSADGSVRAVLNSDNVGDIDRALQLLKKGPGEVARVDSNQMSVDPEYDGFSVTATRPE